MFCFNWWMSRRVCKGNEGMEWIRVGIGRKVFQRKEGKEVEWKNGIMEFENWFCWIGIGEGIGDKDRKIEVLGVERVEEWFFCCMLEKLTLL